VDLSSSGPRGAQGQCPGAGGRRGGGASPLKAHTFSAIYKVKNNILIDLALVEMIIGF